MPQLDTRSLASLILLLAVIGAGCSAERSGAGRSPQGVTAGDSARPAGTLKILWSIEADNLHAKLGAAGPMSSYHWIFNSVLTHRDTNGVVQKMIARDLPSQDNGDWVINPDGTMVTTYRLRENARWHDGQPVTAHDYAFAFRVYVDDEIPVRERIPESLMSKVEAADAGTLVINWRESFVGANHLGYQQLDALPRHLMEEKYLTNKANFTFGDEWTSAYIGTGPFRLERWNPGVGFIARANADWFLGPPGIDTLDVRFGTDPNTALANLLAGEVDIIANPAVRTTEAATARDQWASRGEGYVKTWQRQVRLMVFQFREVPNWQRAVTDVRVRRALVHAMDRQTLADTLTHGLGLAADAFINPADPTFARVDRTVTKYSYDPTRAAALLNEAGWQRAQPSALLTGAAGSTLDVEIWNSQEGGTEKETVIIADGWKGVGINAGIYMIPAARDRDHEHRASFPAVATNGRGLPLENFAFTSAFLPTAALRWQSPNRGSFHDSEVDRLHILGMTSLNDQEREQAVVGLHQRMAETLGIALLYYNPGVLIAKNRLRGPIGETAETGGISWNIHEWMLRD